MTSAKLNNRSKLYRVLTGLGLDPKKDEEVDVAALKGTPVKIRVSKPDDRGFQNIESFEPIDTSESTKGEEG